MPRVAWRHLVVVGSPDPATPADRKCPLRSGIPSVGAGGTVGRPCHNGGRRWTDRTLPLSPKRKRGQLKGSEDQGTLARPQVSLQLRRPSVGAGGTVGRPCHNGERPT